jgi:hypothetical protein
MTYTCTAWELAEDYHLKLQRLRITENLLRCTPVRDLHTAFNLPYVYGNKCRQKAEVVQNHESDMFAA